MRSLAWLIGSPALLAGSPDSAAPTVVDDAWCAQAYREALPMLAGLERDPAGLESHVAARANRRLGRLAETLISFWLRQSTRFELLAENVPVRVDGSTLGEFDFVFRDLASGECLHWEMAVKFYLHRPGASGLAAFVGPEGRDVFAHKVEHMFDRQLSLGQTEAGAATLAAIGAGDARACAFVKGWLFYPATMAAAGSAACPELNPAHGRGWWAVPQTLARAGIARRFGVVGRPSWLAWPALADAGTDLPAVEFARQVEKDMQAGARPMLAAGFGSDAHADPEINRGMIVPAHWPEDAGQP